MYLLDLFRPKRDELIMMGWGRWAWTSQLTPPTTKPLSTVTEEQRNAPPPGVLTVPTPEIVAPPALATKRNVVQRSDVQQEKWRRQFLADIVAVAPYGSSAYDVRTLEMIATEYGIHKSTASRWQKHLEDHCLISRVKMGRRWARRATAMAEDFLG